MLSLRVNDAYAQSEPGNEWNSSEADPELQTLVSSLSSGPLGPSDKIGLVNVSRVLQSCMADGTLLKADAPAMQLDSTYVAALHRRTTQDNGIAHIWHTVSSAEGSPQSSHNHLILAANITRNTTISLAELRANAGPIVPNHGFPATQADAEATAYVAVDYYSGRAVLVRDQVTDGLLLETQALKPAECRARGFTHEFCTPFKFFTLCVSFHNGCPRYAVLCYAC